MKRNKKITSVNQLTARIVINIKEWLNLSIQLLGEIYTYTVLKGQVIIYTRPEVAERLGF